MSMETKNKVISFFVTTVIMMLLLLLLYYFGLYSQNPPPEPKNLVLIEFSTYEGGGGGGGGNYKMPHASGENYVETPNWATQDAEDVPVIATSSNPKPAQTKSDIINAPIEPQPEPGVTYKPGKGSGTGGGSGGGSGGGIGTGTGTGKGAGMGTGEGGGIGSGKGPGYGTGNRAYTNIPDVNINENGVVYVEVHINVHGSVINARIINTEKFPTTITNAKVQQDCLNRALSAKYVAGKDELRIIMFK